MHKKGIVDLIVFIGGVCCLSISAAKQPAELVSELEYFTEIPSIASVTRLPQPRSETPAAVTIIDREMILASGIRSIADLLRMVPGIQVAHPRGSSAAVTYHGLGDNFARRMQVLVDGRSVYGAFQRSVTWSNINIVLEDIERIEVIRGPDTVSYGANAFFATINIITTHSAQAYGNLAKVTAGGNGILDATARFSDHIDTANFRLTADFSSGHGLDGIPDDYRQRTFNIRSDLQPSARDNVMFQFGVSKNNLQTGNNNFLAPNDSTGYLYSHSEHLSWSHTVNDKNEISLQVNHNQLSIYDVHLSDSVSLPTLGTIRIPINMTGTDHRYDIELQTISRPWPGWRFVWGMGASEDSVRSENFFHSSDTFKNASKRLFSNGEWRVTAKTVVNAGLMWEETDITGTDVSPRLAVNYHLDNRHTLRAVWSRAIRTPSLFEQYGDVRVEYQGLLLDHFTNNQGGLLPERLTSYEFGYLANFPKTATTLDLRIYIDNINDYINTTETAGPALVNNLAMNASNGGRIKVSGFDVELTYRPARDTRVVLTNSIMRAVVNDLSSATVLNSGQIEQTIPAYSGSLLAMRRFESNWYASLAYYWVDEMIWIRNLPSRRQNPLDAYTQLDIRLAQEFNINGVKGELKLIAQNVDGNYTDFLPKQYFTNRAFISLTLNN